MMSAGPFLARSFRAEWVRTAGPSRLWTVLVPVAIATPVTISLLIALVAERFARIPGQMGILQVSTSNAAYWAISISVVVMAAAGADGCASESRYRTGEYLQMALPGRFVALCGKWVFYGLLAAVVALSTVVVVLLSLPLVSHLVYGDVWVGDGFGRRLLWTVPIYAFFAAGAAVGLGAMLRSPAAAVGTVFLWAYVIETAAGYLPNGASLQRFMPGLNAMFATGQDIALTPPWGPNSALAYVCLLFTAVFGLAAIERKR